MQEEYDTKSWQPGIGVAVVGWCATPALCIAGRATQSKPFAPGHAVAAPAGANELAAEQLCARQVLIVRIVLLVPG